ncbi:PKD domain-containing protein [Sinomonas sp. JGH33]|uniref:PKD domain-containing protein n=1 Tax=Sinomonas terricola TaxID=3110330 RepID=A0ABU5TB05_9MICC|nr:PKD domain-containing protein [Sinomonas sp. JGH33]MEA5456674.1 PKD domain-containing protein [Sinomonas sp. JGH33]
MNRVSRWTSQFIVICLVAWSGVLGLSGIAQAATTYGIPSFTYSGVSNPPTSDKPQSKLWWNDGSWWADLWASGSGWHIYRLDRGTETWVDTGVLNDPRGSTLADVLWDGSHLYIASHVVTVSTNEAPVAAVPGDPALLYRYSYSNGTYTLDSGFPAAISNNSSESMTIDEDSTGAIWATWTQVSGNSTSGFTNTVYANYSAPGGAGWATPFVLPVSNPNPSPDDISGIVAFGKNKLGVMWSDQLAGTVWWAWRTDGTNPTASSSWNFQPALKGQNQALADDHLNLKQLQADSAGRVFAAVKTSLNDTSSDPTLPQLLLLVFRPGTGAFTSSVISTTGDCVTRPQIVLDTTNNLVHEFQTAPSTSVTGCPFSGVAGSIYEKTASMDNPVFGSGRGTPVIQDGSSANMNNVTTTKQSVNSSTGIVALASDNVAKRYWFSDRPLGPAPAAPVASFAASPTSGVAPLNVSFTDTSTGSPTSWAWAFGDGGTSTAQNPTHSYAAAGTYTAKLTASNAGGSSSATTTITVTTAPPPAAPVASFTASPTSGVAPLSVGFTDTSSGSPTSWAWAFGDGGTSTAQNPTHSYAAAGTYTAKLTASNAGGSSSATTTITVNTAPPANGISVVGSTTTYSATAVGAVSITTPSGTAAGDVLVAAITVDLNSSMASVPAGWTAIVNGLGVNSSSTSGARIYSYYHVMGSSEPSSYSWTLGTAVKWGAGLTAYRGVNNTTPLDTGVVTAVDTTYTATTITLPSITTATNGAMLIGGVGLDAATPGISPPSGWTQLWQAAGGQISELADVVQANAGASGTATWTLSTARGLGAWRTALKPAG